MTSIACVFPGQGSQKVGMGKALRDAFAPAREVFGEVDDALGQHLSRLMFEGPEKELTLTANAQPAIMATSLAALRVMEQEAGFDINSAAYVAGHSLGEYSALTAAGVFNLADTARLLRIRGEAMQQAVPEGEGAMAAILGLELDAVERIAAEAANSGVCEVANDNAPGQVVISGSIAAVKHGIALAKEHGAKRALFLPVSAPFHCSLMQPAAKRMKTALGEVAMQALALPLVANVTAAPTDDPAAIRELLVSQVTGRVRWSESVQFMEAQGVERIIEIGEGRVLSGLIKRISRDIETIAVGTPGDVENWVKVA